MNLIEQLKDPKQAQPFGIYVQYFPEKAAALKEARKENCLWWFRERWEDAGKTPFTSDTTYILKPDYQPEPEYVDLEIELLENGLYGVRKDKRIRMLFTLTHANANILPIVPGFRCFWLDDGDGFHNENSYVSLLRIAGFIDEGKKVYARFRTKEQE